jgi:hypothetical protein
MRIRTRAMALAATIAIVAWSAGCGEKKKSEDTSTDQPPDTVADTSGDTVDDTTPADTVEDTTVEDTVVEDTPGDPAEEEPVGPTDCGNGTVDTGEVCDDHNADTEFCDTTTAGACLADCSLENAECGDGSADDGEECDDGDTNDTNSCSNSCTDVASGFGDPCHCTGGGCSALDFTAGTIVGCDGIASLEDSSRTLACMRTAEDTTYGVRVYGAGGYCMLMAMSCTGSSVACAFVPTTGDTDTITCPAGTAMVTDVRTQSVGIWTITITTKSCMETCTSQAGCRWNAEEDSSFSSWAGTCGQWMCLPGGDGGEWICADPRNASGP